MTTTAIQSTLDDLGTPLHEVTFVVVDLETTGGSAQECAITEIGAVKVRGGERLGEFQTLVNPGAPIPGFISVLTGITDAMVASSPRIDSVLPAFLEFAADAVLVAHNAPFDIGFLKAASSRLDIVWPGNVVIDTAHLARQLVHRDEAENRKLGTLARLFGAETTPDHRALHDARATVDVLHALIGRVGGLGVHTLEELRSYSSRVRVEQRRKRHLADGLPSATGVYLFKDEKGKVLYVGTSVDIRKRVRSYFTASEQRTRIAEMVAIAGSVTPVVCATPLEAGVRELRLIAEHEPPYNRRSRRPSRLPWIKLTKELFPRLSIVREVRDDGATYAGPFPSQTAAQEAVHALHDAIPLRQCARPLGKRPGKTACILADLGSCGAPCIGRQTVDEYAQIAERARVGLTGDVRDIVEHGLTRLVGLSRDERFEEAGAVHGRLYGLLSGLARAQRVAPLARTRELVAARRAPAGGWEVICVRYGRLAGTTRTPPGADPMPFIEALRVGAEVVPAPVRPRGAATAEESELVLRWLEEEGTRLVHLDGEWLSPVGGAVGGALRLRPSSDPLARAVRHRWDEPRDLRTRIHPG